MGRFVKNTLSVAFILLFSGGSIALAAITLSNTSITGDSSFTGVTGVTTATFDFGTSTLQLQTTNGGPLTTGAGLFTAGGALNVSSTVNVSSTLRVVGATTLVAGLTQSGGLVSLASTTVTGQATTTALSITGLAGASGCLSVSGSGLVTTSTCSGTVGTVTTSSAISTNNFPFWGTAGGALSGTSTLSISGTTLTQANAFLIGGNLNVTGTATFVSSLTQSGGLVSLASTTVNGSLTFKSSLVSTSTVVDAVSTCGSSPSITGSNGIGRVTTGSNASTTCTVTFGIAFANKPVCTVSSETTSSINYQITPSASTLVITTVSSSAFISNTVDYLCIGQ